RRERASIAVTHRSSTSALRPGSGPAERRHGYKHRHTARQRGAAKREAKTARSGERSRDSALRIESAAQSEPAAENRTGRRAEFFGHAATGGRGEHRNRSRGQARMEGPELADQGSGGPEESGVV